MALDNKSRIAIAASLIWMAMATFVILGTHGEAVAKANTAIPTLENASEWMAHPAHLTDDFVSLTAPSQC
ncbi:MAG: hypothetical protein OEU54_04235 [Gemmatimonadota bacterium]|nr:hypothetical protein [Gemmatimonadota bacterium]